MDVQRSFEKGWWGAYALRRLMPEIEGSISVTADAKKGEQKMKKVAILLILCLVAGCAGCGNAESVLQSPSTEEVLTQENVMKELLGESSLAETSVCVCVAEDVSDRAGNLISHKETSVLYMLAQICEKLSINPIVAFYKLVDQKLYQPVSLSHLDVDAEYGMTHYFDTYNEWCLINELQERPQRVVAQEYHTGDEAAFIGEVLRLSAVLEDGVNMEELIMRAANGQTAPGVQESEKEGVSYTYYVYSTDYAAHILCIYIHHDKEEKRITDVEFQMLTFLYYEKQANGQASADAFDPRFASAAQLCSLIDAVEMNLTGTSAFHQEAALYYSSLGEGSYVKLPGAYTLGDYMVTISQRTYESCSGVEQGDPQTYEHVVLTNYRISK